MRLAMNGGIKLIYKKDTRQLLIESFIDLSLKKPVEKISVSDIVRNCGLGRQTFYNRFNNKYDLINWFYTSTMDNIIKQYKDKVPRSDAIGYALTFINENRRFFGNAISEEGQESFFNSLYEYIRNYYTECIRSKYGENTLTEDLIFAIKFNCHGVACMIKEWLKNNMEEPPLIIAKRIADNMPQALKTFFT
jgi:probable dihydroxyacetone kinase regulator